MTSSGRRGVVVHLDIPEGPDAPDATELVDLAEALHELARDLIPSAVTRTEVTLPGPAQAGGTPRAQVVDLSQWRQVSRARLPRVPGTAR